MRSGVRLGIDVGKARIGVARSDLHGMLATPVETVPRDPEAREDIARLLGIVGELDVFEVIVGLPLNMRENTRSRPMMRPDLRIASRRGSPRVPRLLRSVSWTNDSRQCRLRGSCARPARKLNRPDPSLIRPLRW